MAGHGLQDIDCIVGHGLQDMDCRIQIAGHIYGQWTWIAGHGYGHGSQDMDRRTGIAGHGHGYELQDIDMDMDCRTWTRTWVQNSKGKEFKSSLSCVIN